ncbi:hypothetical protein [Methanosarcina mazei]|nr:hypothetical protein [Methanosarcina mazei]MDO5840080.1 hypothetical protein [Methanosarcina mazei]MDY0246443.1 hypothetical protein [Methanosarcina mazei]
MIEAKKAAYCCDYVASTGKAMIFLSLGAIRTKRNSTGSIRGLLKS